MTANEQQIEQALIEKLGELKYTFRPDMHDRAALEQNFRAKFEALNRVTLTQGEFSRLLEEIIGPDVITATRTLRERNSFNYEAAVQREMSADYPKLEGDGQRVPHHRRRPHRRTDSKARCPQDHKKGLMQQLFPSPQEVEA